MLGKFRNNASLFESTNFFLESADPPQNVFEKRTVRNSKYGKNLLFSD